MLTGQIEEARVLDLYAGTGAVGIEALSRGACQVDFVDLDKKCTQLIKANLAICNFDKQATVYKEDASKFVSKQMEKAYDLIFFTPPYPIFSIAILRQTLPLLKPDGCLVAEMDSHDPFVEEDFAAGLIQRVKTYGDTRIIIFGN